MSNDDSEDNSNGSNFRIMEKSDTHDNNLTLRLKGLGKKQVGKSCFHRRCIIYLHLHSQLGNNKHSKTCKVYHLPLSTIGT